VKREGVKREKNREGVKREKIRESVKREGVKNERSSRAAEQQNVVAGL